MSIVTLTTENFEAEALQAKEPVLVDFWAEWCAPCRMLSPLVEEIAGEMAGKVKFGKLNVDEAPALAALYGVQSIPTLLLFKEGKVAATSIGVRPKAEIMKLFGA
ncbi:MAG: thioredoxin [Clostridiales bacterium]|nr:thioredoxin [Clostridiales bacterium]